MHKDHTTQAKPKKDEREEVMKEIRQLENRQKILENKQRNEERKARTRRLIERGRTYTPLPVSCALPGAVALSERDGELLSPNPLCATGHGTSASGCPVPCGLNTPH